MRNVVILSAAKDLYEMCTNNILNPSSYLGPMTMALSCNNNAAFFTFVQDIFTLQYPFLILYCYQ